MPFNWFQSKLKKQNKSEAQAPAVSPHATTTVFGPVPWTIWHDSGLEIVCEEGRDAGLTLPLEHAFLVIGRGRGENDHRDGWLLFTEDTVSRRQAVLCWNVEKGAYYLYHLQGATNETCVDRRSGEKWRIGVGSTVEMGNLRFRVQRRLKMGRTSTFVLNTLERLGRAFDDAPIQTGLALTAINGEDKGATFMLTRKYHVLHQTANDRAVRLLERGQAAALERDLLAWNEEARTYELVHNGDTEATVIHPGRPSHRTDIFAASSDPGVEVLSEAPILLREGDTICLGTLHLRIHRYVRCLLDGTIGHILQKGYIEEIPTVDKLVANGQSEPPVVFEAPMLGTAPAGTAVRATLRGDDAPENGVGLGGWINPDFASTETVASTKGRLTAPLPDSPPTRKLPPRVAPGVVPPRTTPLEAPVAATPTIPRPASDQPVAPTIPRPASSQPAPPAASRPPVPSPVAPTVERPVPEPPRVAAPPPAPAPRQAREPRPFCGAYALEVVAAPGLVSGAHMSVEGDTRIDMTHHPRVTIGASLANQVAIPNDMALESPQAAIEVTDRGLVLRALDGVSMVNKMICLKEAVLRDGDEIRLSRNTVLRIWAVD